MTFTAAGHRFEHTSCGIRCTACFDGETVCGAAWVDVRTATPADVGKHGIAHTGYLTEAELAQIIAAKLAEEEVIWGAVIAGAEGCPW